MAIELVESEIRRFLSTVEPEVVSIDGHWGVGKTYAWKRYLADAQARRQIALKRYSYVSLFGVNSLDEFKYAIFENSVQSSGIGVEPNLETLRTNTLAIAERLGRKSISFFEQLPRIKSYVGSLGPVWFLSVKETIVCVDDIERRGDKLSAREVLGLVSTLKEQKKCKIALIWNNDAPDKDKEEFQRYYEKVVDTTLKFIPSAEECARIALNESTGIGGFLAECCIKLGVSNIRVIKKIERSVSQIEPMVAEFDTQVLRQAVHSLTLLGWCVSEPTKAPSLDYLKRKGEIDFLNIDKKTPVPENEAAWNALLGVYEFGSMDEFDLALLEGIRNGYFDPSSIKNLGSKLDKKIKAGNLDASFNTAWRMYHDSFDDNQDQVLDAIYDSFLKGVHYITPMNLSSTVTLFKQLGREAQGGEMLKYYIEARCAEAQLFDLRNYPFSDRISDPDVIKAFKDKFATLKQETHPTEILLRIADTHSWNHEDILALSTLSVDEYYKIFKATKGLDLRKLISACLMFNSMEGATPDYQEIPKRAREGLTRIGEESAINAQRVKAYGVELDSAEPKH